MACAGYGLPCVTWWLQAVRRRYPLLPLLLKFMEKQPGMLDLGRLAALGESPVMVPLEDGEGVVPVPAARLHRILSSLSELSSGNSRVLQQGRLPVHRLRAAALAARPDDDPAVFRHAAEGIVRFVNRELSHASGGFFSALDADSDGEDREAGLRRLVADTLHLSDPLEGFSVGEEDEGAGPDLGLLHRLEGEGDGGEGADAGGRHRRGRVAGEPAGASGDGKPPVAAREEG